MLLLLRGMCALGGIMVEKEGGGGCQIEVCVSPSSSLCVGVLVLCACATTAVLLSSEPTSESESWFCSSRGLELLLSAVAPMTPQVD